MKRSFMFFLRCCLYEFVFLLSILCVTSNNVYSQNNKWNTIKNDENWDVFAYKPPKIKRYIALSLSRLQEALISAEIKPETPLPITKIKGVIFDDSGDVILLGIEESGDGVVNIVPDDIVLAMRSMLVSDQPPGVSIDPLFNDKSDDNMGPFQDVIYFGGIKDTRAGLFAFNSDYYMKRLAAGKINVRIKNFSRYADLIIKQQNISFNKGDRFWFYPKESQFIISSDYSIMMLYKSGIEILTEEQHTLFEKKSLKNLYSSKKINLIAKKFADQFTNRYDELSKVYPDLAKLKNFFALCEVFKWAEKRGIHPQIWKYLLYEYHPVHIHTPSKADTVKVMLLPLGSHALFLMGGVQGEIRLPIKPIVDTSDQLISIKKAAYLSKPSSTVIYWEYSKEKSSSPVMEVRLKYIKEACKNLKNGSIIDLFVGEENVIHANVVDTTGNVRLNTETAKELRELLNDTAEIEGPRHTLLDRWQKFYHTNLSRLNRPTSLKLSNGNTVKLKPTLIIESNEVNYKYAKLEKVPVLTDNFVIFIALKNRKTENAIKPYATELVRKINNIPSITKDNMVFAIRLPDMKNYQKLSQEWNKRIGELERVVGKENVLYDPSKKNFNRMLNNQSRDIIIIELTHTDKGIVLKDDEAYTSKDLKGINDLSHIKYLISGLGTCRLPQLEDGGFVTALRDKGINMINASYGVVSAQNAFLGILIQLLQNLEISNVPAYYLPDIIRQLMGNSGKDTVNLGKCDSHKDQVSG